MVNIPGRVNAFEPGVDAHRDLRHGDGTTAIAVHTEAADARVPYSTDACYWHVAQPLMRSERIRRRWRAAADVPGARIAIRARGFTEWTRSFFLPPASAEGTTFYLAAVRHPRGGFSFLTRESEGELAFHHRCPIVLDWDAARRWASSEGDDVSALDAHLTARLVNGDRLQPPITSMLSVRALAPPSLDSDSEGSATEDEEEEEERDRDVPSDEPIPLARPRPDETPMSLVDWTARQTELLGALGRLAIAPEHASPKRRASARLAARLQRKLAREAAERALRVELIAHLGEHGVDQPRSQWELEDVRRMLEVLSRLQRWLLAGTVAAVIDQLRPSPEHADLLANFVATLASVIAARGRQTTRLERQRRVLAAERPEPPLGMLPTDEARRRDVVFFNGGPWCEHPFATILLVACAMPSLIDVLDGFRAAVTAAEAAGYRVAEGVATLASHHPAFMASIPPLLSAITEAGEYARDGACERAYPGTRTSPPEGGDARRQRAMRRIVRLFVVMCGGLGRRSAARPTLSTLLRPIRLGTRISTSHGSTRGGSDEQALVAVSPGAHLMKFHRPRKAYQASAHVVPRKGSPVPAMVSTNYVTWPPYQRLTAAELAGAAADPDGLVVAAFRELEIYVFGEPTMTKSVGELQSGPTHAHQHDFHRGLRRADGLPMGGYAALVVQRYDQCVDQASSINLMFDDSNICVRSLVVGGGQRIMSDGGRLMVALAAQLGLHKDAPLDLLGGEVCFVCADIRA